MLQEDIDGLPSLDHHQDILFLDLFLKIAVYINNTL